MYCSQQQAQMVDFGTTLQWTASNYSFGVSFNFYKSNEELKDTKSYAKRLQPLITEKNNN